MVGISYVLVDFVTGGPILDLPVKQGASWAAQLNRPDTLSCAIDMRDAETLSLDLAAATEPKKTILAARDDYDNFLAWGLIDDDREWDENTQTLSISAKGVTASWLDNKIIAPAAARTSSLTVGGGKPNPALDTTLGGYSLGGIGRMLVAQALTWPGAPTYWTLPVAQAGTALESWPFPNLTRVGKALSDLTNRENGPDFAFDLFRSSDGMTVECVMRHGSTGTPRIGAYVGIWPLAGTESPISNFKVKDNAADLGTASWSVGGKQDDKVKMSRALSDDLIDSGYPPLDFTDTSHNDVTVQDTLDDYTRANADYAHGPVRSLSFDVRGDASPRLGEYRPGDTVVIDVGDDHAYLGADITIRITSMSGDETGKSISIGCEVIG